VKRFLSRLLPGRLLAVADFYLRPGLREPTTSPFNGQRYRQQLFLELLGVLDLRTIVETGTFRGSTTDFLAAASHVPVYTVEFSPRYYYYARLRFRHRPEVRVFAGDSRSLLERLAAEPTFPKTGLFFYLDAHWYEDLPLRGEIELITRAWQDSVVMIDDFAVPDDEGYGCDDYGPGRRLDLDYLGPVARLGWSTFFPTVPSAVETGWKRGCVVIAQGTATQRLSGVRFLSRHDAGEGH
jgi:hypothetical protein